MRRRWPRHTSGSGSGGASTPRAGTIVGGEQLAGPATARRVDLTPDGPVVTDGPFAEASEVVGGFAVVEVPSMDAAVELAKTWPGTGPVEVRPTLDM